MRRLDVAAVWSWEFCRWSDVTSDLCAEVSTRARRAHFNATYQLANLFRALVCLGRLCPQLRDISLRVLQLFDLLFRLVEGLLLLFDLLLQPLVVFLQLFYPRDLLPVDVLHGISFTTR